MPRAIVIGTAAILLGACATEPVTPPAVQTPAAARVPGAHAGLATLLDRYFEELLELSPILE
jgi:hypothetical protein